MPYYGAGDYYRGDYYRGDGNYAAGGIFSGIGKLVKKVGGALFKATPVGAVASAALPQVFGGNQPVITGLNVPIVPKPGIGGTIERLLPGGESGYMVARRRRMNVTNVRALRRAGRRVKGFLKIARRLGALPVSSRSKGGKLFKPPVRKKK